jgi:hypothetical protein
MGNHLLPCPGCARHVRAIDPMCPFCGAALPTSLRQQMVPRVPLKRLGRSATLAFGAALAAAGCGDAGGDVDAGRMVLEDGGGDVDAGKPDAGMEDAGTNASDGGSAGDAGMDAGTSVALYGGPTPADAGMDSGISITPLYGGPSLRDAGNDDDAAIVAAYGTPADPA